MKSHETSNAQGDRLSIAPVEADTLSSFFLPLISQGEMVLMLQTSTPPKFNECFT